MEVLKYYLSAVLCLGFIFFLIARIFKNANYTRKAIYLLISGGVITCIFLGGFLFDVFTNKVPYPSGKFDFTYFAYLIVSIIYTLLLFVIYFVKGRSRRQRFKAPKNKKEKVNPTIKDKQEYVYVIFKLNNNVLLYKDINENQEVYHSIVVKFRHHEYFHDEVIKKFITENKLNINDYKLIGKAIKHEKKDMVFYCYQIDMKSKDAFLNDYIEIPLTDLIDLNINEMDKKIIFTSIVENNFEIEL